MGQIYTRFQTKTAQNPYPFGRHILERPQALHYGKHKLVEYQGSYDVTHYLPPNHLQLLLV